MLQLLISPTRACETWSYVALRQASMLRRHRFAGFRMRDHGKLLDLSPRLRSLERSNRARKGDQNDQLTVCCPLSNMVNSSLTVSSPLPRASSTTMFPTLPLRAAAASTASSPRFWSNPLTYCRWASHERPAIFYSMVIGSLGPIITIVAPPLRKRYGDGPRPKIPLTYPSKSTYASTGHAKWCHRLFHFIMCYAWKLTVIQYRGAQGRFHRALTIEGVKRGGSGYGACMLPLES